MSSKSLPKSSSHPPALHNRAGFSLPQALMLALLLAAVGGLLVYRSFAASGVMTVARTGGATGAVALGSTFSVTVTASGGTDSVNAVQADLTYPTDKLQLVTPSDASGSAYPIAAFEDLATAGSISHARGYHRATASDPTGLTGSKEVVKFTFRTIGLGNAAITLDASSQLIADANATNVLVTRNGMTVNVTDTTAPATVTGLTIPTANRTMNSLYLTWNASTDNSGTAPSYRVLRSTGGGATSVIKTVTTTNTTDTGLAANTSYTYSIVAIDGATPVNAAAASTSATASTLGDSTAPSVPGGVSATGTLKPGRVGDTSVAWSASTDNVAVAGYRVYRNGTLVTPTAITARTFTETGVAMGTYAYTVVAVDTSGNASAASAAANAKIAYTTNANGSADGLTNFADLSFCIGTYNRLGTYKSECDFDLSGPLSYTSPSGTVYQYNDFGDFSILMSALN